MNPISFRTTIGMRTIDLMVSNCMSWCLSLPDCHPSSVRHSDQENQNRNPGAKRSGHRHGK